MEKYLNETIECWEESIREYAAITAGRMEHELLIKGGVSAVDYMDNFDIKVTLNNNEDIEVNIKIYNGYNNVNFNLNYKYDPYFHNFSDIRPKINRDLVNTIKYHISLMNTN